MTELNLIDLNGRDIDFSITISLYGNVRGISDNARKEKSE